MEDNKDKYKNMIKDEYLNKEWSEFKVTNELKEDIKNNPGKYANCDVRTKMGKFYTDEEKETNISAIMFASEAQYNKEVKEIFKNEQAIEALSINTRNDFGFLKLFYKKINSGKKLKRINELVAKIPTRSETKLKLYIYQELIIKNYNKNSDLSFETKGKYPRISIKNYLNTFKICKNKIVFQELSDNNLNCVYYDYINESTHKIDFSYNEEHIKIDYKVEHSHGGYRPTIHMKYYIIKNNEDYYLVPVGECSTLKVNNEYKKFEICQNELSALKQAINYLIIDDNQNKKRFTNFKNDIVKTKYPELPVEMVQYIEYAREIIDQYYELEDPNYIHKTYEEVRNMNKKHALINNTEALKLQIRKYRTEGTYENNK